MFCPLLAAVVVTSSLSTFSRAQEKPQPLAPRLLQIVDDRVLVTSFTKLAGQAFGK